VQIYNRWGQLVYESDQVEFTWDGKNQQGKDLPQGTYFVLLNGIFGDKDVTSQYPISLFR
jgi:gliding motility-associated-like protein